MPTRRPRHFVTETEELAAALDSAAQRWPELSRAQLVVKLALEGSRCGDAAVAERRERRAQAIRRTSGLLTGSYGPEYLAGLRADWPA